MLRKMKRNGKDAFVLLATTSGDILESQLHVIAVYDAKPEAADVRNAIRDFIVETAGDQLDSPEAVDQYLAEHYNTGKGAILQAIEARTYSRRK